MGRGRSLNCFFPPLTHGTEQLSPFCFWGLLVMSATAKSPRKLCERSLSAMRHKCVKNCRTWERYGFLCRESAYRRNLSCCSCLRIIDSPSRSLVCWNHKPLPPFPLPAFPPWITNAANNQIPPRLYPLLSDWFLTSFSLSISPGVNISDVSIHMDVPRNKCVWHSRAQTCTKIYWGF